MSDLEMAAALERDADTVLSILLAADFELDLAVTS